MLTKTQALVFLAAAVVVAWLGWQYEHRPATSDGQAVEATDDVVVRSENKVSVAVPEVRAYKPKVKEKLPLPSSVQKDPDKHVATASDVPASDHEQQVITVLDAKTGESVAYVAEKPLPWLALNLHGEAGVYYGVRSGGRVVRLEARQNVLQIKALYAQLVGSVEQSLEDGSAEGFVGAGVAGRW